MMRTGNHMFTKLLFFFAATGLLMRGSATGDDDFTHYGFIVDLIQGDSAITSGACDLTALGDVVEAQVVVHAQNFFFQQNITIVGEVEVAIDESTPGDFVDPATLEDDGTVTLFESAAEAPSAAPSLSPSLSPSASPSVAPTTSPTPAPTAPPTAAPVVPQLVTFAMEDFDGNDVNLLQGYDPNNNWDGGIGDYFGVGAWGSWPQSSGIPYDVADETAIDMGVGHTRASDDCGIYGQNSDPNNNFFDMSDLLDMGSASVEWIFDVTDYTNLKLSIDLAGISNLHANYVHYKGFGTTTDIKFTVEADGCTQEAFNLQAVTDNSYSPRPMDNGNASGGGRLLKVTGDNAVTKHLAEDGSIASNQYLDKSVPSGPGQGQIDTFTTDITCATTTQLKLTMTVGELKFESVVFDNIKLSGFFQPSAVTRRRLTAVEPSSTSDGEAQRRLYQSYWFTRVSATGTMSCTGCSTENNDGDFRLRRLGGLRRRLMAHSLHSEYESYMSFHLTRDVRTYLAGTVLPGQVTCLGYPEEVEVYFAVAPTNSTSSTA